MLKALIVVTCKNPTKEIYCTHRAHDPISLQITQEWNTPANETMEHFRRAVEGGGRALKGDRVGVYQNVYLEIDGKDRGRISAL